MDWDSSRIRKEYIEVTRDAKILPKSMMEEKYLEFKTKYEKLYELAIRSVVNDNVQENIKTLDMMLLQRDRIKRGKISEINAGMVVGNQLGHKYIYPVTNVPSKEDYVNAIDKINAKAKENNSLE